MTHLEKTHPILPIPDRLSFSASWHLSLTRVHESRATLSIDIRSYHNTIKWLIASRNAGASTCHQTVVMLGKTFTSGSCSIHLITILRNVLHELNRNWRWYAQLMTASIRRARMYSVIKRGSLRNQPTKSKRQASSLRFEIWRYWCLSVPISNVILWCTTNSRDHAWTIRTMGIR